MYFPFLRGKQFELLALRSLIDLSSANNYVNPLISPVKKRTSTYDKTITKLQSDNINFTIVLNPVVGDLKGNIDYIVGNLLPPTEYKNHQIAFIVKDYKQLSYYSEKIQEYNLDERKLYLILVESPEEDIERLSTFINNHNVKALFVSKTIVERRRSLREIRKLNIDLIPIEDSFSKQLRNKDYSNDVDEFFSDEHLYFNDDNFLGYSDFITIGQEYSDKGFSPYAVAIHLTYFNNQDEFRIMHFVSDSNDDTSDIAGKFSEALEKLIPFINTHQINSIACNEFRKLYREERYPGLGTVKKLSIMNHFELVNNYFNR